MRAIATTFLVFFVVVGLGCSGICDVLPDFCADPNEIVPPDPNIAIVVDPNLPTDPNQIIRPDPNIPVPPDPNIPAPPDPNIPPPPDPNLPDPPDPNTNDPNLATITGTEIVFSEALVNGARETRSIGAARSVSAVANVFNIWNQTGAFPVGVGTLTLDALSRPIAYDQNPQDRLVVVSPSETVEYFYEQFDGDTSGLLNFVNNHTALVVRIVKVGAYDFKITSAATPTGSTRRYQGTVVLPRGSVQVDVVDADGNLFDFDLQAAYPTGEDFTGLTFVSASSLQGTVQSAGGSIDVSEVFESKIVNTVQQTKIFVASTGQFNGSSYAMGNVYFQQVERDGLPSEPDFWRATGQLFRDNVAIGNAQFVESPNPITDPSPKRMLVLIDGTKLGM